MDPDLTSPIIVCGVARSGTSFTRDLIDSHPAIAMTDEFFLYKVPSAQSVFGEITEKYGNRQAADEWCRQQARLMRALWMSASRESQALKGQAARRFGNKTPGAEHYFEFYENVFAACPPRWVYVLREGEKVFTSRKNMQWGNVPAIQGQVKRYLQSIELFESCQLQAPDRFFLFQLDRIEPDSEARQRVTEALLAFAGERLTSEVERFVEQWPVINAAQRPATPALQTLSPDERAFLAGHGPYQAALRRYGYRP